MVKLRKGVAYRSVQNPYTRKSKYRKKSFVRSIPTNKVVKFDMGDLQTDFPVQILLKSKQDVQLRHNCLESARKTALKLLETKLGKLNFRLKIRVYPHHILRENSLASGAGADRMSTGMKAAFGKAVGIAARVFTDQPVMEVAIKTEHRPEGILALKRAYKKLPGKYLIEEVLKK
jgi:large subunit ribosomal protein L10e